MFAHHSAHLSAILSVTPDTERNPGLATGDLTQIIRFVTYGWYSSDSQVKRDYQR
jgi:hypothetical protein